MTKMDDARVVGCPRDDIIKAFIALHRAVGSFTLKVSDDDLRLRSPLPAEWYALVAAFDDTIEIAESVSNVAIPSEDKP